MIRRYAYLRRLAALATVALAGPSALAQEEVPQQHEVDIGTDIGIETQANTSIVSLAYTFTPAGIDRQDEVIPALRRFVRHPSALWTRIERTGASGLISDVSVHLGGVGYLLDGGLYATGEIGLQRNDVEYDPNTESRFDTMPYLIEAGGRPVPFLQLGAFFSGAPIIGADGSNIMNNSATRSGGEKTFGGSIELATPDDRFYLKLRGSYRWVDWSFEGTRAGDFTARAPQVEFAMAYNLAADIGFGIRGYAAREHWVDTRFSEGDPSYLGNTLDRHVWNALVVAELSFWWKAHIGFNVFFGGGYRGAPPLIAVPNTGLIRFGFGVAIRF